MGSIPEIDRAIGTDIKVLGISWNTTTDTLKVSDSEKQSSLNGNLTKRRLLHFTSSIFDPLGLFSPVTLLLRAFIQKMCYLIKGWDDELPPETRDAWNNLESSVKPLVDHRLNRCCSVPNARLERLVCFTDASATAYCAVVYLITTSDRETKSTIIFSKTRLAPVHRLTIPRLELMAVLIGVRCLNFLKRELRNQSLPETLFTDSRCVLNWINSKRSLSVFVENRIREIRSTGDLLFRYVPTEENPAEIGSRGCSYHELERSFWWAGPAWIKLEESRWPNSIVPELTPEEVAELEVECKGPRTLYETALLSLIKSSKWKENSRLPIEIGRFPTVLRLIRLTAWVLRYAHCLRRSETRSELSPMELQEAKVTWEKDVQWTCFEEIFRAVREHKVEGIVEELGLKIGPDGLMHCGGRLQTAELIEERTFPKLLPKYHYYSKLMVEHVHRRSFDAGVSQTLAESRREYWIPHGRRVVQRVLRLCLVCK